MRSTQQSDVIVAPGPTLGGRSGRNFRPLVAAGSWTISGFHHGHAKCACCGRPINRVLHLRNQSHDATSGFPEEVCVGIVCGPRVFMESCIGFYEDPAREWDRQRRAWRDYINYIILCVRHERMWSTVPAGLREPVDAFLKEGYLQQGHSGGWWMVRDAKRVLFRAQRHPDAMPPTGAILGASRALVHAARRQGLVTQDAGLRQGCDGKLEFIGRGA